MNCLECGDDLDDICDPSVFDDVPICLGCAMEAVKVRQAEIATKRDEDILALREGVEELRAALLPVNR